MTFLLNMVILVFIAWGTPGFSGEMFFSLPIGGAIHGALEVKERYGGQIIEEINKDYCSNLGGVKPFEFKHK